MIATALLLVILVCTNIAVGFSTLQAQKEFSQKAGVSMTNEQSFYLYNNSVPFNPTHPTGIFFANESDLQFFVSAITQNGTSVGRYLGIIDGYVVTQGYNVDCYLEGNGTAHTYTSSIPNTGRVVVNGRIILIDGQISLIGNISVPINPSST